MTHLYTITVLNLQARAHTRSGNAFSPVEAPTDDPQAASVGISPKEAARLDPEAFLQFAEEVARVARKLRESKQLRLEEVEGD